jgi:hypothetical protein
MNIILKMAKSLLLARSKYNITKMNWLMQFRQVIATYCECQTELKYTVCLNGTRFK